MRNRYIYSVLFHLNTVFAQLCDLPDNSTLTSPAEGVSMSWYPRLISDQEKQYDRAHPNLTQCFVIYRNGGFDGVGGVYRNGTLLPKGANLSEATGLTYAACVQHCGAGRANTSWFQFSQEISAWLLPWLALISQLPYGSRHRLQNLSAMALYIGSPALSAYSLMLTLLNHYYVAARFSRFSYPNAHHAASILASLQQTPLDVDSLKTEGLLPSLVVLPQNDRWFRTLRRSLKCEHGWSAAAFASVSWVIIAYVLTASNTFIDVDNVVQQGSSGQAVASVWLWLLPIVVGWLQLSPKCDSIHLEAALNQANKHAWVATDSAEEPMLVSAKSDSKVQYTIDFRRSFTNVSPDEEFTPPIFNYARIFSWSAVVEEVAEIYELVSQHRRTKLPVRPSQDWEESDEKDTAHDQALHPRNRIGTREEIIAYCILNKNPRKGSLSGTIDPDVALRIFVAAFLGLGLQWLTVGGAIIIVYYTPTMGLGCRATGYLLFGFWGSVVLGLMIASSILAHIAERPLSKHRSKNMRTVSRLCRRAGKVIAAFNAIGHISMCTLQFIGVFTNCWCASRMPMWNPHAYTTSLICESTQVSMRKAWMAGVLLAGVASCMFFGVVKFLMRPPTCRKE